MPDLDRVNRLIANILETPHPLKWTESQKDALTLLKSDYMWSMHKNASGYFVVIADTPWTGRCRSTLTLAICDAFLRQHGIEMGDTYE